MQEEPADIIIPVQLHGTLLNYPSARGWAIDYIYCVCTLYVYVGVHQYMTRHSIASQPYTDALMDAMRVRERPSPTLYSTRYRETKIASEGRAQTSKTETRTTFLE